MHKNTYPRESAGLSGQEPASKPIQYRVARLSKMRQFYRELKHRTTDTGLFTALSYSNNKDNKHYLCTEYQMFHIYLCLLNLWLTAPKGATPVN